MNVDLLISIVEACLVLFIWGSIVFYLFCALYTYQFFSSTVPIPSQYQPPVTIMIPVRGLDVGAWENWLSFCQQDYPSYEVFFGVMDEQDSAITLLQKLVDTFPDRVRLFTGLPPRGANYKDSILSYLLEKASYEHIVFVDSDIRVNNTYLSQIIAPLADLQVGLVTSFFVGRTPQSLGAAIASFGRCFDFIPSALTARILDGGLKFAVGATLATRKSTLVHVGGLHLNRIGSDYNLGKRVAQAGYRVELSPEVLESDTGDETISEVFQRELRWARTIRFNRGTAYYGMVFCYGTVYCIFLVFLTQFSHWALILSLLTYLVRYTQVLISIYKINCPKLLIWLCFLPLRDVMSFFIWGLGSFGQKVFWRGRLLRIEADGLIQEGG